MDYLAKKNTWYQILRSVAEEAKFKFPGLNLLELLKYPFQKPASVVKTSSEPKVFAPNPLVYSTAAYLPIELLRHESYRLFLGSERQRKFLSSGTTATHRSVSLFSTLGLDLYRAGSLASYFYVIEQKLGSTFWGIQGYSLIPKVNQWPDSSLAQMVEWIADFLPVSFLESNQQFNIPSSKPVWIFGTAFHFMNLIDNDLAQALPTGSILIETGGMKGK